MTTMFRDVRMCELGKIKVGGLSATVRQGASGPWRAPEKHSYFTVTTMNRGPDIGGARGDLLPDTELMGQLQADPRFTDGEGNLIRLPVYLLSNRIGDVLQAAYVWYGGKTVGARADIDLEAKDGPTVGPVTFYNDRTNGKKLPAPVTEPWDDKLLDLRNSKNALLFKPHTVFNCVVAAKEARWGGVYRFRTTSKITGEQLYSGLVTLKGLTNGILQGLPLELFIRPIQVSPEGKTTTVYVVGIQMRGKDFEDILNRARDIAKFMLERQDEVRQIQDAQRKMLVAPGLEGGEDAKDINAEFSPETVEDAPPATADDFWREKLGAKFKPSEAKPVEVEVTPPAAAVEPIPATEPTPEPVREAGKGDWDSKGELPF